jgi:hypothetical protein
MKRATWIKKQELFTVAAELLASGEEASVGAALQVAAHKLRPHDEGFQDYALKCADALFWDFFGCDVDVWFTWGTEAQVMALLLCAEISTDAERAKYLDAERLASLVAGDCVCDMLDGFPVVEGIPSPLSFPMSGVLTATMINVATRGEPPADRTLVVVSVHGATVVAAYVWGCIGGLVVFDLSGLALFTTTLNGDPIEEVAQ